MYVNDDSPYRPHPNRNAGNIGLAGVTAVRMGEGREGRTLADLCRDTLFRMQNREACGQDIDSAGRTIPQPVPTKTKRAPAPEPIVIVEAPPLPSDPTPIPEPVTGGPEEGPSDIPVSGGGGWTGTPGIAPGPIALPVGGGAPSDVYVDVQAPEADAPGFGLVEAAIGAAVAFLVASAWDRK